MGDNPTQSKDTNIDGDENSGKQLISRRDSLKYTGTLIGAPVLNSAAGQGKSQSAKAGPVIEIDPDDTIDEIVEKAANVTPTSRQQEWQELERTAFIHFGVNTFTDQEWGTGLEDPDVFQPTDLDPSQWMTALKDGGFELVILTAKHHDGFCLWPSKYTDHDVSSSSWRNGTGDVVSEVADAAHDAGLKFGVYLSPADLHELKTSDGRYDNGSESIPTEIPTPVEGEAIDGDQSFTYTVDDYNSYFLNQLYELLTEYGPIDEMWFDGANPEPGTDQTYNETAWFGLIRELQPDAVIAVGGPDARWVGNEEGVARKSEWSPLPFSNEDPTLRHQGISQVESDLGSREQLAQDPNYLAWYPAEADTSIRPGWFYHDDEDDQVMSVEELVDTYYKSVGRNANLLLNLPPDQRGQLNEIDVNRLAEFGNRISETFNTDLAQGANVSDSSPGKNRGRFGADKTVDGNSNTYWQPRPKSSTGELIFDLGEPQLFNRASLQESLNVGQRIESFSLDVWDGSSWQETASGTTVGYKRLLRFDMIEAQKVRLRIDQSRNAPTLASFGLYHEPHPPAIEVSTGSATVTPNQPVTVTTSFTNSRKTSVEDMNLMLSVPEILDIETLSPTQVSTVVPGQTVTTQWKLSTADGTMNANSIDMITATAEYIHDDSLARTEKSINLITSTAGESEARLRVDFEGSFDSEAHYVTADDEIVDGQLYNKSGSEEINDDILDLTGGTSGLVFTPTEQFVDSSLLETNIVAEARIRADETQTALATLLGIGGATWGRHDNEEFVYGFTGPGPDYSEASGTTDPLSSSEFVDIALVYTYIDDSTAGITLWENGQLIGELQSNTTAANVHSPTVGFGCDVHPAATDRGYEGILDAIALSTFTGGFHPSYLQLPEDL